MSSVKAVWSDICTFKRNVSLTALSLFITLSKTKSVNAQPVTAPAQNVIFQVLPAQDALMDTYFTQITAIKPHFARQGIS